jgi:hypothetical protein
MNKPLGGEAERLIDGIRRADASMRLAKSNGRGRVVLNFGYPRDALLPSPDGGTRDSELSELACRFATRFQNDAASAKS